MIKRSSERQKDNPNQTEVFLADILDEDTVSLHHFDSDGNWIIINTEPVAQAWRNRLIDEVASIDIQIADESRQDKFNYEDWNEWRRKASSVKKRKCKQIRQVNQFIKILNRRAYNQRLGDLTEESIAKDVFRFLCRNRAVFSEIADDPKELSNLIDRLKTIVFPKKETDGQK